MNDIVLIILIIVVTAFIIIGLGNMQGPPIPESMSIESIMGRMQSEDRWISKYKSLPYSNQQAPGIKKQYEAKRLYMLELRLEMMKRGLEAGGTSESQTLIPTFRRIIELMKSGKSEEEAVAQAEKEFEEK